MRSATSRGDTRHRRRPDCAIRAGRQSSGVPPAPATCSPDHRADLRDPGPGAGDRGPQSGPGAHPSGAARLRRANRGQDHRRGRRHQSLPVQGGLRPSQRVGTGARLVGQHRSSPTQPRRQCHLNAALHRIAITQIRLAGPGRAYLDHRVAQGDTRTEAFRALRRRISDEVFRRLRADEAARSPGLAAAA